MSRENVEIVRRVFEAAARRDSEAVLALYHPEVEWDPRRSPWADITGRDVRHGHEGIRSWYREFHEAFADSEDKCEQLIDAGDYVVSVTTQRARGRASGLEVERSRNGGVWTIRDGKVARVAWFSSLAEALESVGLGDPTGSWYLVEWTSTSADSGETTHPMGEDAEGRIIYTADGRMSAHLMRREREGTGYDEYISYTGSWELRGDEVVHHVELATYPDWPGTDLVRTVEWHDGDLVLTTPPRKGWVSRLRWRRAGAPSS